MTIQIKIINKNDERPWDKYVESHRDATLYHLSGWKNVIENTYKLKTYYLMAVESIVDKADDVEGKHPYHETGNTQIVGILPLVHINHFLFGSNLVSIPFFDLGGILASSKEAENSLLSEAVSIARELKADSIELRNNIPLTLPPSVKEKDVLAQELKPLSLNQSDIKYSTFSNKVRMILNLPDTADELMGSFKSKFRTKIRLPAKKGCTCRSGTTELVASFYDVFTINMRDLGSPVHAKALFENVINEFPDQARIFVVEKADKPIASGICIGFKDTLYNPWASSLRKYSSIRPNTLLYWNMLELACHEGYRFFDFGRSTPNESTYIFKKQWGSRPVPLYWQKISFNTKSTGNDVSDKSRFDKAIHYWKKLPVPVTKLIGPMLRKYINL